ncbi:MAG: polysaccharide biosynthesis C-terminal domain-containing protein, partial [Chitinophagaceae bacterium]
FGALNTYLFIKDGIFTPEQYGLTRAFIVLGQFFYGFAGFGLTSVFYKFYPYYKDNIKAQNKNDLLTITLLLSLIGFVLTLIGGMVFEHVVVQKFIAKSPSIVQYYYWIFPFTFFLLFFSLLEAYAWSIGKPIVPNFLKEAGFRISTTLLIILFLVTGKNFDLFIKLFSLLYALSFFALLFYLIRLHQFHIVFELSRVTRKFWKKMLTLVAYVYGGSLVNIGASSVDFLAIASFRGLRYGAVFDFSSYLANVIQVPQRSLISTTIPVLSRAWKEKDLATIDRIYKRSSLNLLFLSLFIFSLIWVNYDNAIEALGANPIFNEGKWVVFFLALKNIIDMGTGVNGQIIATSTYWRFDFLCGVVLLLLAAPLNIFLVKNYGIIGSAWSNLLAYSVYNIIRLVFLHNKFGLQPFTRQTALVLTHGIACFIVAYYLFKGMDGWTGMGLRTTFFILLSVSSAYYFNISPDIKPVVGTLRKKLRL